MSFNTLPMDSKIQYFQASLYSTAGILSSLGFGTKFRRPHDPPPNPLKLVMRLGKFLYGRVTKYTMSYIFHILHSAGVKYKQNIGLTKYSVYTSYESHYLYAAATSYVSHL